MPGPETARQVFEEVKPDVVVRLLFRGSLRLVRHFNTDSLQFTASMWTSEQSSRALSDAKEVNPQVKTMALPQGLQVNKGPDAVIEYIKEQLPKLLEAGN